MEQKSMKKRRFVLGEGWPVIDKDNLTIHFYSNPNRSKSKQIESLEIAKISLNADKKYRLMLEEI